MKDADFTKSASYFLGSLLLNVDVLGSLDISVALNPVSFGLNNSFKLDGQYPCGPLNVLPVFFDI